MIYRVEDVKLHRTIFGINFTNPVGLAAGFDKDARLYQELHSFGFGFIEVGTVTPLPQSGNDKPRMFRLLNDEAIINRMGFNNDGVKEMIVKLKNRKKDIIIGGNIGKNKETHNEQAINDYEICFRELFNYVDYFAINVSSPNTPGLRSLQNREPLLEILLSLQKINSSLASISTDEFKGKRKPILVKISPDLTDQQLDEIVEVVLLSKIDGIIAVNTTVQRNNLKSSATEIEKAGAGGLSGKPLSNRSTEIIRYLSQKSEKRFQIIGVGGIHSSHDAIEKLKAGADLIQLYTGFIYEGPGLIKNINKEILKQGL